MIHWKRATLLGGLSWLIPLAVSFIIFPLKASNPPLFQSLMSLVGLATGGILLRRYFRHRAVTTKEAVSVGILWFAMNIILDYPIFFYGPIKMQPAAYYSEIGVAYLGIPAFALFASRLAKPGTSDVSG